MPDTLRSVVKQAEQAVAGVADKNLKTKAFELVLQELLQRGRGGLGGFPHPSASPSRQTGKLHRVKRAGLTQRILELIDYGFLKMPRSNNEIGEELKRRGHHYADNTVGMALLRLVRKRVLRRVPKTKGKNPVYGYVAN